MLFACFAPNAVYHLGILVGADAQGCAKYFETMLYRNQGCFSQAHGKANFAALTPLRLILEASYQLQPFLMIVASADKLNILDTAELFHCCEAVQIFFFRLDVGIVEKCRYPVIPGEQIDNLCRAGATAGVNKQLLRVNLG